MSVILVTDVMERVEAVLTTFRHQTIAGRLELVLATGHGAHVPEDVGAGFAGCTVLTVDDPTEVSRARAECVRAATAPIVAIGETHCLPEPGWCEGLLTAHGDPAVATVGSAIVNANPQTALSWASYLLDYGPWATGPRGSRSHLPAHNVAFKRDLLLALGDGLDDALEVDSSLTASLLAAGRTLQFEPRPRAHHLNVSIAGTWWRERVMNGRTYAAYRSGRWGLPRRLAFGMAWPLIPLVRLARLIPIAGRIGMPRRALPAVVAALVLASAGEGIGYLLGPGRAPAWRRAIEIRKGAYLRKGEATAALERVLALKPTAAASEA